MRRIAVPALAAALVVTGGAAMAASPGNEYRLSRQRQVCDPSRYR